MNPDNFKLYVDQLIEVAEFMKKFSVANLTVCIDCFYYVVTMDDHDYVTIDCEGGSGYALPLEQMYEWKKLFDSPDYGKFDDDIKNAVKSLKV